MAKAVRRARAGLKPDSIHKAAMTRNGLYHKEYHRFFDDLGDGSLLFYPYVIMYIVYIYIYTYTYTYIHIYIYTCVCVCDIMMIMYVLYLSS